MWAAIQRFIHPCAPCCENLKGFNHLRPFFAFQSHVSLSRMLKEQLDMVVPVHQEKLSKQLQAQN